MEEALEQLCRIGSGASSARGHDLSPWQAVPGQDGVARSARCRRCGRVAYARIDTGLSGLTGEALTQACDHRPDPTAV